ncbi:similar to Saccharomyces cerevisiae YKL167C MRP49 Mitochondrial ribosomal protein of the large subunit, not essential for mitochondrial translation [Maudiozyma saulgeensis]|uniref:Similar to Saccharomyces cerevisiae YKL167C MRP49 Mitochondrial ribosomal protein of the large subunit, not essential for mitochondrial translation n=1 Tax=Maudiozyma saulgeensis TaxID=1789683 RepID=A0A1X7R1H7_9SACH|nr:similar to Saccharomyces cerevisiae YKL167C MRP49 Mitochondrial ribosomal protein of the large subunit, not essential for mitochondrial translation [Kazachstania saulgeensis]
MSKIVRQKNFLNAISYTTKKPQVLINGSKYQGIRLTFQVENHSGHMGPRMLWRKYLPTLQFYNPNLKIDIIRIYNKNKAENIPCILEVLDKGGNTVETIDMKNKMYDSIMDEFLNKVDHKIIPEEELVHV